VEVKRKGKGRKGGGWETGWNLAESASWQVASCGLRVASWELAEGSRRVEVEMGAAVDAGSRESRVESRESRVWSLRVCESDSCLVGES
jgi:hypothetical protein